MNFPVAWPADAGTRDKGSGEPVKNFYKQYGLRMMADAATHAHLKGVAANSLEGGVKEIDLRERNGKWKVGRNCISYLEERRLYHRKDGEIVRLRDDALSAARYGAMMREFFDRSTSATAGKGAGAGQALPRGEAAVSRSMQPAPRTTPMATLIHSPGNKKNSRRRPGRACCSSIRAFYVG